MIAKVTNVQKSLNDREIIKNVSFSLEEGSINAILGPNGVGKTTTVRILTGLLIPTKGTVEVFGTLTTDKDFDRVREFIGVQNDGNLYESLTVYENLRIWAIFYNIPSIQISERIDKLLHHFDLHERKYSKVGTLSKGLKQKVSIIRAMLHNPKLLILDEPTSGLDPSAAEELIRYIQKIVCEKNITVFMCTHQLQGLEKIADNIFIMYNGEFIVSGNSSELLSSEWPGSTFEIVSNNPLKCLELLKNFSEVIITCEAYDEDVVRVSVKETAMISKIIEMLVCERINIYEVTKVEREIKEFYFKKIGEVKHGEY